MIDDYPVHDGGETTQGLVPRDLGVLAVEDLAVVRRLQSLGQAEPQPRFLDELRLRMISQAAALTPETPANVPLCVPASTTSRESRRARSWARRLRTGAASVAAAALLTVGGLAAYTHTSSPNSVSAEVLLKHVAAALPGSGGDQVVHEVQVTRYLGILGLPGTTRETWTQVDASGTVKREALTETVPPDILTFRMVQDGTTLRTYDAVFNIVETRTLTGSQAQDLDRDPYGVAEMRQLVATAQAGTAEHAQIQPRQTIGGSTVDVVKLNLDEAKSGVTPPGRSGGPYSLLFIDPDTYAIRGVDSYSTDASGVAHLGQSMRISLNETMQPTTASQDAFAFAPPPGARVAAQAPVCTTIPVPEPITVAQAVSEQDVPAYFVSGTTAGLQLQRVERFMQTEDTTKGLKLTMVTYTYKNADGATLSVAVSSGGPSGPAAAAAQGHPQARTDTTRAADGAVVTTLTRPQTVLIAGVPVDAVYSATSGGGQNSQDLTYGDTKSGVTVAIHADDLSSADFIAAIASLVDGRAQPAVASHLQQQLDTMPVLPATQPKQYCGDGAG
jgi:hypothetical protein